MLASLRAPEKGRPPYADPSFRRVWSRDITRELFDAIHNKDTCELPHRSRETFAEFGGKSNA